jgi:DNA-binding SARP family transcriptional activator/predicted ATPase
MSRCVHSGMRVRILGPVSVVGRESTITDGIEAPRQRAVLAALALRPEHSTTTSELIDAIWGDEPPKTAAKTLQGYVSDLRRSFGDEVVSTTANGYQLGRTIDQVDAAEFEQLIADGSMDLEAGDARAARASFGAALALWQGEPLADLAPGRVRDGQVARLAELRLLAVEGLTDARLRLGQHREVIPELERAVREYPYREEFWRLLMIALHRAGRSADALRAAQRLRSALISDLGIEPSRQIDDLERQILQRDPALDPPEPLPLTNLVVPLESLVDRADEVDLLVDLLGGHRLVTLLGMGGVGKSRLANEVGRAILPSTPGGVWWVDLSPLSTKDSIAAQVASAMGVGGGTITSLESRLLARLRRAPSVIVLDNCEHLKAPAAEFVIWITGIDPRVVVLVTTRVPLDVPGERRFRLEPLSTLCTPGEVLSDAATLFIDRSSSRDVEVVAGSEVDAIVDLVGGLPLGVELAAAQCMVRSLDEIAAMLRERGGILALGRDTAGSAAHVSSRHESLGHVLDTSVELLDEEVACSLPLLAVFPGDFDLAAATAVIDAPLARADRHVQRLFDASLLAPGVRAGRFRVLWPVQEYLSARLRPSDRQTAQERHARHFHRLARRFIEDVESPAEQQRLEQLRDDDHNLRAALGWFEPRDPVSALDFAPVLGVKSLRYGDQLEGRELLDRLLAAAPDADDRQIGWAEDAACWVELLSGDVAGAVRHIDDSVRRFESAGDARGLTRALRSQAHVSYLIGEPRSVTDPLHRRAIDVARAAGLDYSVAVARVHFVDAVAASDHDLDDAEEMLVEAEEVLRGCGDHFTLAHAAQCRAYLARARDDGLAGRLAGEELLRQGRLAGSMIWELIASLVLGFNAYMRRDEPESRRWLRRGIHLAYDADNLFFLGTAFYLTAATIARREPSAAAQLWGRAVTLSRIWPLQVRTLSPLIDVAREQLGGDRFDELTEAGSHMSVADAVALADTVLDDMGLADTGLADTVLDDVED